MRRMKKNLIILGLTLVFAEIANASEFVWNWHKGDALPINVHTVSPNGNLELTGTWTPTERGGCKGYEGTLVARINNIPAYIKVDNVGLRNFCTNSKETQHYENGFCEYSLDKIYNLNAGYDGLAFSQMWVNDERYDDYPLTLQTTSDSFTELPATWFDIDFDGDLELLVSSVCSGPRGYSTFEVYEPQDFLSAENSSQLIEPALIFHSGTFFNSEKRTGIQWSSNSYCSGVFSEFSYDGETRRFIHGKTGTYNDC